GRSQLGSAAGARAARAVREDRVERQVAIVAARADAVVEGVEAVDALTDGHRRIGPLADGVAGRPVDGVGAGAGVAGVAHHAVEGGREELARQLALLLSLDLDAQSFQRARRIAWRQRLTGVGVGDALAAHAELTAGELD